MSCTVSILNNSDNTILYQLRLFKLNIVGFCYCEYCYSVVISIKLVKTQLFLTKPKMNSVAMPVSF